MGLDGGRGMLESAMRKALWQRKMSRQGPRAELALRRHGAMLL